MGDMADYYREAADWYDLENDGQRDPTEEEYEELKRRTGVTHYFYKRTQKMAPKAKKLKKRNRSKIQKPVLIQVGRHFIAPSDIRCISSVKKGTLYIIKFYSEPNPEYPCFCTPDEIGKVLEHFDIISGD
jgi:hypothetical protein